MPSDYTEQSTIIVFPVEPHSWLLKLVAFCSLIGDISYS